MSRLIIYNASILTLDDHDTFYYPGTVEIEGQFISKVYAGNPDQSLRDDPSITFLDGTDKLVMPGLVDLHFHTSVAKSGTTTVNDMYRFLDSLADAASKIGIRAVLSNEVALAEHQLDSIDDNEASFESNNGRESGRIKVWMGHEWMCTSNLQLMEQVGQMKKRLGTCLHIHLSESEQEVADVRAKFGKSPVEIAYETGCLGPDTVAAHCVHLTDRDISLLAATGTSVSYDPGSNAKLGNGIARLQDLLAAGVNVGMGIDAFECENSPDMFEQMKFGSLIQRALHKDASLAKPHDILRIATRNGAKALGIHAGIIEPGRKADVIVLDLTKNQMFTPLLKDPAKRKTMLESHLVFGCNGSAVQHSIIDGVLVMKDFNVLAVDEQSLRKEMDTMFEGISEEMKKLVLKPREVLN
ncbi:hypothetical protein LCI18_014114 [Fusarium solani-melongenae]|uniref:Uncharacterized protein n=1 Tax=Fusarium solani subsp. cucurbitae TaxID=2747967 RepID=A0ACD3ZPA6_FUSSC|nr:hypothetical protein LCI18_014114 [Fusarium solani-melongenae]